jgi:hypothetical protein
MSSSQKTLAIVGALILVIGGIFLVTNRKSSENQSNVQKSTQPDLAVPTDRNDPASLLNQVVATTTAVNGMEYKTIRNESCGFTLKIPSNWSAEGYLGESKIVSPEDARTNEEWANAHQDLIQNAQGDAPLGPDARSLYISCQYDVSGYLGLFATSPYYKDFADAQTLADAFSSDAFKKENSNLALLKTMEVDGRKEYEISWTVERPELGPNTTYMIVSGQEKVLDIEIGKTEYDNLSDTIKQIIGSITFEK